MFARSASGYFRTCAPAPLWSSLGLSLALVLGACGEGRSSDGSSASSETSSEATAGASAEGSEATSAMEVSTTAEESSTSESESGAEAESGTEGETGLSWADIPCAERPVEACAAYPLGAGGDYDDYCSWTELEALESGAPACGVGETVGICLTYGQALDGCADEGIPGDCADGYSLAGVLDLNDAGTLVIDLTDMCMFPREVDACRADAENLPASCECACDFLGMG